MLTRIAIVNADRCKPNKCNQECKKSCPIVRLGRFCIDVNELSKISTISESMCIGCGICVKVSFVLTTFLLLRFNFFISEMSFSSNKHNKFTNKFRKGYNSSLWSKHF